MINKGDKVVIIGDSNIGDVDTSGKTGVVRVVDLHDPRATYSVEVEMPDGDTLTVWYPATSVEPVLEQAWIENTTGKCPFKKTPNLLIDVRYRNGKELFGVKANAYFTGPDTSDSFWILDGWAYDIVAYRVAQEESLVDQVARLEAELAAANATIADLINTLDSIRDLV